jgi:hypothetical protein
MMSCVVWYHHYKITLRYDPEVQFLFLFLSLGSEYLFHILLYRMYSFLTFSFSWWFCILLVRLCIILVFENLLVKMKNLI